MNELDGVVMAEIWLDGKVLIEERWEDIEDPETGEVRQETRYAIPGGKIEAKETVEEAVIREVEEEIGLVINPEDEEFLNNPEVIQAKPNKVMIFRKLLTGQLELKDGIILCTPPEVLHFGDQGRLMPYTDKYTKKEYVRTHDSIDN